MQSEQVLILRGTLVDYTYKLDLLHKSKGEHVNPSATLIKL